jgi:hypothetical protein
MISDQAKRSNVRPVWVALAVAVFGMVAMLLVDHGPWARPHAQDPRMAVYQTTGEAAHAVGAHVQPTPDKSPLEPDPLGPKRAAPPNPEPGLVH